ncbi:hypothetical protein C100_09145 [Sphingobium sp. C100]|nr:hypothetical protein C100_09145 [Sphingobium sp. C100]
MFVAFVDIVVVLSLIGRFSRDLEQKIFIGFGRGARDTEGLRRIVRPNHELIAAGFPAPLDGDGIGVLERSEPSP